MTHAAYMITLGDHTAEHRSFARAAQHLAVTLGDAYTVASGARIVEFSEDDGILLVQTWTPRMSDGEITWTTPSPLR